VACHPPRSRIECCHADSHPRNSPFDPAGHTAGPDTHTTTPAGDPAPHAPAATALPELSLGGLVDPKRLLWLGGLVGLGVVGFLEWPVVAAVGVGSYVAEQFAEHDARRSTPHL